MKKRVVVLTLFILGLFIGLLSLGKGLLSDNPSVDDNDLAFTTNMLPKGTNAFDDYRQALEQYQKKVNGIELKYGFYLGETDQKLINDQHQLVKANLIALKHFDKGLKKQVYYNPSNIIRYFDMETVDNKTLEHFDREPNAQEAFLTNFIQLKHFEFSQALEKNDPNRMKQLLSDYFNFLNQMNQTPTITAQAASLYTFNIAAPTLKHLIEHTVFSYDDLTPYDVKLKTAGIKRKQSMNALKQNYQGMKIYWKHLDSTLSTEQQERSKQEWGLLADHPNPWVKTLINMRGVLPMGYLYQKNKTLNHVAKHYKAALHEIETGQCIYQPKPVNADWPNVFLPNPIGRLILSIMEPNFLCLESDYAYQHGVIATTRLAIALTGYREKYGTLPRTLQELVPEFMEEVPKLSGATLVYSSEQKKISFNLDEKISSANEFPQKPFFIQFH